MNRREFIKLLGGAATWPLGVGAQQAGVPLIGILMPGTFELSAKLLGAFYQGMNELGYTAGRNVALEARYADWHLERLPALAAELVRLKVDVIVVFSTPPARAAKLATNTTPIIVVAMADPVGDELVVSLARPGGNVTGTTFLGPELIAKRMGLLKETLPGLSRVAALLHPNAYGERTMKDIVSSTETAARALNIHLQIVEARSPNDFENAFSAMTKGSAGAFIAMPSPMLFGEYKRIVELAAKERLPAMYAAREFVDAGGFMSYGANTAELFRRAATYLDKILKGAKSTDLPVEQPTKFEFFINLKTTKTLGIEIPATLLAQADELIE